jgi:H+-transporting ATPase
LLKQNVVGDCQANVYPQAAAVLAAGLQDWVDFGVICALLLLNACVGFIQEFQAGSIVEELKKTLALKATVLRDGKLQEIEAPEVVPGDILQIEEVRTMPCFRLLTACKLTSVL